MWGDTLNAHLAWLTMRGLATTTVDQRRRVIRRLERHLATHGTVVMDATLDDLDRWQQSLAHLTPAGHACEVSHVSAFYAWALRYGHRDDDPSRRLVRPRKPRRLPRPISEGDLAVALDNADPEVRAWLLLACDAGMRALEVAHLERADVLDGATTPVVHIRGKGGAERVMPLSAGAWAALRLHGLPRHGYVFLRGRGPYADRAKVLSREANAYLHGLGISATFHQLRHRAATRWYEHSRDLLLVKDMLGHASPATTAGYAAVVNDAAREVIARIEAYERDEVNPRSPSGSPAR